MALSQFLPAASVLAFSACLITPLSAQSRTDVELPGGLSATDWSEIQSVFEARVHRIEASPAGFEAFNPSQGWWTE
ncbi:MAG: hypothetical protein P1V35_13250, partial [Planctomycetota bacterium]|nr:hypothetical protein [Planctomycetota bacterium]